MRCDAGESDDDGDDGDGDDGGHEDGGGAAVEGGDTGMSMAGICLMPPQATIAAVQHQPFPLQCSLPASLHDPPHVQVLTEGRPSSSEDPGVGVSSEPGSSDVCRRYGRDSRRRKSCSSDVCRR